MANTVRCKDLIRIHLVDTTAAKEVKPESGASAALETRTIHLLKEIGHGF